MTKNKEYKIENSDFCKLTRQELFEYIVELHEALERSSWQGLSNDRIREIGDNCLENNNGLFNWIDFARAIEQALKDKND